MARPRSRIACRTRRGVGGAVLALLLTACGGSVATSADAPTNHSSSSTSATPATGAPLLLTSLTGAVAVGALPPGPVTVRGSLPTEAPVAAAAYQLTRTDAAKLPGLISALGMSGSAQPAPDGGYTLRRAGLLLQVSGSAGGRWTLTSQNGGVPVPDAAPDVSPTEPTDPVNPTVTNRATAVLTALLRVEGRSGDEITATRTGSGAVAVAEHRVQGLQAVGFDTRVGFGTNGTLQGAAGWLGEPTDPAAHPMLSATAAVARVPSTQGGLHPDYCVRSSTGGQCAGQPHVLTGAAQGLLVSRSARTGDYLLAPAWLYTVQGQDQPEAVVAAKDATAATPSPSPTG